MNMLGRRQLFVSDKERKNDSTEVHRARQRGSAAGLQIKGIECCCFGTKLLRERNICFSPNTASRGSSEDLLRNGEGNRLLDCKPPERSRGLRDNYKSSTKSLRKFSCRSSADVLPSLTSAPAISGSKQNKTVNLDSRILGDPNDGRRSFDRSREYMEPQNSHKEGWILETGGKLSSNRHPALSDSTAVDWSFSRSNALKYGSMNLINGDMRQQARIDTVGERTEPTSIRSLNSSMSTTSGTCFIESIGRSAETHGKDMVRNVAAVLSTSSTDDRRISTNTQSLSSVSPMARAAVSAPRNGRMLSLDKSIWNPNECASEGTSSSVPSFDMPSATAGIPFYSRSFESRSTRGTTASVRGSRQMVYQGRQLQHRSRRRHFSNYERSQDISVSEENSEVLLPRDRILGRHDIPYEQVRMLEPNLLRGGMTSYDQHRDLRLDIDDMSYEDLLALGESIGYVCTGIEKDMVPKCLKSEKYRTKHNSTFSHPVSDAYGVELKCSICQEDFEEGVELGILKCGHNHHFSCIEQWLQRKNECPICKTTAFIKDL